MTISIEFFDKLYIPYVRHYNPRLVYFLLHFQRPFLYFKEFFFKFCPCNQERLMMARVRYVNLNQADKTSQPNRHLWIHIIDVKSQCEKNTLLATRLKFHIKTFGSQNNFTNARFCPSTILIGRIGRTRSPFRRSKCSTIIS